jgi:hypothetical protein
MSTIDPFLPVTNDSFPTEYSMPLLAVSHSHAAKNHGLSFSKIVQQIRLISATFLLMGEPICPGRNNSNSLKLNRTAQLLSIKCLIQ